VIARFVTEGLMAGAGAARSEWRAFKRIMSRRNYG